MKILFVISLLSITSLSFAQKIKVKEGSVAPLKNEKSINIEFTYDENLHVGKMTEADYIAKRQNEMNKKEAGKGDKWVSDWKADRKGAYEPKFIKLFEDHSKRSIDPNAKYTLVFNTTFIEPGYNVGVSRGNAYIDGVATIVETANRSNIIAVITVADAKGKMPFGSDFASSWRIAESYARAGRELAQVIY